MCNKYVRTLIMIAAVGFDPWSVSSKGFEDMLLPPRTTAAQQLPVGTTNVESEFHHISRLYVATILVLKGWAIFQYYHHCAILGHAISTSQTYFHFSIVLYVQYITNIATHCRALL